MRLIWLVLAACGGTGTPAPAPLAMAPPGVPLGGAFSAQSPHVRARLVAADRSWTDIVVEGTEDDALTFCEMLLDNERVARPDGTQVLRPCAVESLPQPPTTPVQLVEVDVANIIDRTATLVRVSPQPDQATCERERARREAEDDQEWLASLPARKQFLDEQVRRASLRQTQACAPPKSPLPPEVERQRRECNRATEERKILEREREHPAPRTARKRSCRVS